LPLSVAGEVGGDMVAGNTHGEVRMRQMSSVKQAELLGQIRAQNCSLFAQLWWIPPKT